MVDFDKHIGLAIKFCKTQFLNYNHLSEDIQQIAYVGLWRACQSFDETKNKKFSTFAYRCMLNEVLKFLKEENKFYSISVNYKVDGEDGCVDLIDIQPSKTNDYEFDLIDTIKSRLKNKVKQREIETLELYLNGYSKREISKIQGVKDDAVRIRIEKCLKALSEDNFFE